MEECGNRASLGFPALVLPPVERRVSFSVLGFFFNVLYYSDCDIAFPEAFVENWGITFWF